MGPHLRATLALGLVGFLAACDNQEAAAPAPPPIRAIKHMTIEGVAAADSRVLAGVVEAGTSSNVAFEIGGRVVEIAVTAGDEIAPGQYLARLDPKPFELKVAEAEFSLRRAEATLTDAREKYKQQQRLWEKRFTTKTALDTAVSNLRNAEGQVGIAKSQLELVRRDLSKTRLEAPFGGRVAERLIDVFEEVSAGQAIFRLQSEGESEIAVSIPESLISQITLGLRVDISFPPLGDAATAKGVISEIAPVAGGANAFPAKIRVLDAPDDVRSGMSARITFTLETGATGRAYTVPVGAIVGEAGSSGGGAKVYVFDPEEEVVRERAVQVVGVEGNTLQIIGDVKPGDVIATAGVSYLFDGMEVRLLDLSNPF